MKTMQRNTWAPHVAEVDAEYADEIDDDEMPRDGLYITLARNSAGCRVVIDGHDVTRYVTAITTRAEDHHITSATLDVLPTGVEINDPDFEVLLKKAKRVEDGTMAWEGCDDGGT